MVTDQDEWVKVEGGFVRSKIFDIPLQSLFFALLNYRHTMERYFYLPSSQEESKIDIKMQILNFEFVHLQTIKGDEKNDNLSVFAKKIVKEKNL